jgi:hypothetical protein
MHKFAIYSLKLSLAIFMLSLFTFVLFGDVVFAANSITATTIDGNYYANDPLTFNINCDVDCTVVAYAPITGDLVSVNSHSAGFFGIEDFTGYGLEHDPLNDDPSFIVLYDANTVTCDINNYNNANCDLESIASLSYQFFSSDRPINNNIFGASGLLGTSTNLLASVAVGVTDTGASIWPLFVFLGVALAFVIAGKVRDFIMEMGAAQRKKEQYYSDLSNARNQQKIFDVIEKKDKGGYN